MSAIGTKAETITREDYAGLLIDRLAAAIIDDSLPLKEVERELRGCVADVAVHRRGLCKRETASRCGVTEKSIENYLKEVRTNPKSPEREVARLLQDRMMSLEEVYEAVRPVLASSRNFSLDDAKRAIQKLVRTGEVREYPERKYRAIDRPSIRYPETIEAHRELVDQKARDLDYIVLTQKDAEDPDLGKQRGQRYSRVVADTSLVRVDFTVPCDEEELPNFYERISEQIAKVTMDHESKEGTSRVRMLLGFRSALTILMVTILTLFASSTSIRGGDGDEDDDGGGSTNWELDTPIMRGSQPGSSLSASDRHSPLLPNTTRLMVGDLDLDHAVRITDAILLTKFLAGEIQDLACTRAGDIDGDGIVNLADAMGIFEALYFGSGSRLDLGMLDSNSNLPCEEFEMSVAPAYSI